MTDHLTCVWLCWEKEINYIDDDMIIFSSSDFSALFGKENTETVISRATGDMKTAIFSINENGKREAISIVSSGTCVKNKKLF